jgi:serine/threonine-protein phosphatase 2A regulatory subunit B'
VPLPQPKSSSSSVRSVSNSSQKSSPDIPPIPPPIVVVSPDSSQDGATRSAPQLASQDRLSLPLEHPNGSSIPRTSTLNRLRAGPKDTIPIVGKPPRKQRSSRFIVTEKVDIERLAPFLGLSLLIFLALYRLILSLETPPAERPQLFVKKLHQCRVLFDFNDASAELKGKQIKAQTLHEMLEYITTQRGVITDAVYPEVVGMVSLPNFSLVLLNKFRS